MQALWRDTEVAVKFLTNQTLGAKQLEEFESEIALMWYDMIGCF